MFLYDSLGVVQPPSTWFDSGCGGPRARWLTDGRIEIEGQGTLTMALRVRAPQKAAPAPPPPPDTTTAPDDSEIPFAWLLPLLVPATAMSAGALSWLSL